MLKNIPVCMFVLFAREPLGNYLNKFDVDAGDMR